MNVFRKLFHKVSAVGSVISTFRVGQPIWTPRDYAKLSKESYEKNVHAYRCINLVADGASRIPWQLMQGDKEIDDPKHPLLQLLHKPNPWQAGAAFFKAVFAYYKLSGNVYLEQVTGGIDSSDTKGAPVQLFCLRPDRVKVVGSNVGTPMGYVYSYSGKSKTFDADPNDGSGPIVHWKSFHPTDDFYGMSDVEAAAYAIDQHNEAGAHNKSLLQNGASPSGAVTYNPKGNEGAILTPEQYERLKKEIEEAYTGAKNAGRPLLLDGGLTWQQMGLSPRDMDWMGGKNISAKEICLAFGVPPYLFGLTDATYNNQREARQGMFEDTVLPMLDAFLDHMNMTIVPLFGEDLKLGYDEDAVPALAPKREARWTAVQNANWISTNEKREATGYEPLDDPEADAVLIPSGLTPLEGILDAPTDPHVDPVTGQPLLPDPNKPEPVGPSEDDVVKKMRAERKMAEKMVKLVGLPSLNGRH